MKKSSQRKILALFNNTSWRNSSCPASLYPTGKSTTPSTGSSKYKPMSWSGGIPAPGTSLLFKNYFPLSLLLFKHQQPLLRQQGFQEPLVIGNVLKPPPPATAVSAASYLCDLWVKLMWHTLSRQSWPHCTNATASSMMQIPSVHTALQSPSVLTALVSVLWPQHILTSVIPAHLSAGPYIPR